MRVAVFGGTGFVGSYLIDALVEACHEPVVLVRPGSEGNLRHPERCRSVIGDVREQGAVDATLRGCDAVIYDIGIIRERPEKGITFEALHQEAAKRVVDTAGAMQVRRFLMMSANGVRPDGTAYQRTKEAADRHLQGTDLAWTIFRPSIQFGDPRGRMEFATQLQETVIRAPLPAPLFFEGPLPKHAGSFRLAPVRVQEVARAFARALEEQRSVHRTYPVCGPRTLTWEELLDTLAAVEGVRKTKVPIPAWGAKGAVGLLERFAELPVTRDQLAMLLEGNTCDDDAWCRHLGIEREPFDAAHLAYLKGPVGAAEREAGGAG